MRTSGNKAQRLLRQLCRRGLPLALLAVGFVLLQASECTKDDFYDAFSNGIVDDTGPLISNLLPAPNAILNDVMIMATITDPLGSGVDESSIAATGDDGADLAISPAGASMFNADIADWTDGLRMVTWSALDLAGNESNATQTFTIDRTAPVVTVDQAPPGTATSDDPTFTWTVGVNIVEPHFLDAFYNVRLAGADNECGTGDDVTPTTQQVPTSTFSLEEGSNSVDVVTNNGVQPGGQPMTAIYCGSVTARDNAVTKTGDDASNTFTSPQFRTELTWLAPPGGGGDFNVVFTSVVTDHRGSTSVICWLTTTSPAQPGAALQVVTTGPGVLTPTVNTTLNAGGMAAVEVGINLFGNYSIMQTATSGSNQASASTTHNVGPTESQCPAVQSSIRFKERVVSLLPDDVRPLGLRPVAFRYREPREDSGAVQIGLVAEEVAEVFPAAVFLDAEGRPESIHYGILTAAVVAEIESRVGGGVRSAIARLAF